MFVKIYEEDTLIVDSGPVVDSSDILTGGRVGLISHISYLISHINIINISYLKGGCLH